jgi:hypothetical protein
LARLLAGPALVLAAVAVVAVGCFAAVKDSVLGNCTTTRVVLARTVPVLERGFDVVELERNCEVFESSDDSASLALAGNRDYPSRAQLVTAVAAQLRRAGWRSSPGSAHLAFRDGRTRYVASVTAHSVAPSLAFIKRLPGARRRHRGRPREHADGARRRHARRAAVRPQPHQRPAQAQPRRRPADLRRAAGEQHARATLVDLAGRVH